MDLQQQLANLRNTVRLMEQAGATVTASEEAITAAARQIAAIVRDIPDGLLREQAWQQARPQVLQALTRMSEVLGRQLYLQMAIATPEQASWAASYITTPEGFGFSSDMPGAAAARRAEALATGANPAYMPRTVEVFEGKTFTTKDLLFAGSSPDLLGKLQQRVPDDVRRLVESVQLDGHTLREWFGDSVVTHDLNGRFVRGGARLGGTTTVTTSAGQTVPRFASFSLQSIDRQVRAGFLGQVSTEEIARNLIFDEIRGRQRLGVGAVRLKSDARTIARTGLMELADAAHMAQWEAMEADRDYSFINDAGERVFPNRNLGIQRWRWDASLDSRVCPSCTALDGREWANRSEVPARPHPQCRCAILPVTATELAMREEGMSVTQREKVVSVELTNQAPPKQRPNETRAQYRKRMSDGGWFISQGRGPSGERWFRRRVERPGNDIADWVADMATGSSNRRSAAVSLQEYFGGGDAGAKRAKFLELRLRKGDSPQQALEAVMRGVGGDPRQVRWHKVSTLQALEPSIKGEVAVLSARQAKAVAKASKHATSPLVKRLERQLAEAREEAAIEGDDGRVAVLEDKLRRARATARVPLSRIPRPRRGY